MAINKVTQNNNTLIDLTDDTVTTASVKSGLTFHLANGNTATGAGAGFTPSTATFTPTVISNPLVFSVTRLPTAFVVMATKYVVSSSSTSPISIGIYLDDEGRAIEKYANRESSSSATASNVQVQWTYSNGELSIRSSHLSYDTTYMLIYI